MSFPITKDVAGLRGDVLRSAGLVYADREERFDRIARLAARIIGVPMAMINLVGEEQWTRASHGIDADVTLLADSICRHAVDGGVTFMVPDLSTDDRFWDNRFVVDTPGARFYAAEPLSVAGEKVGTLCLLDTRPRELSDDHVEVLKELAAWAEAELNNDALNTLAQEAHQSGRLTRAVLESAGDGIVASDHDGRTILANQAAETMLGWEPGSLVGRSLHEVAHHTRADGTPYPVRECAAYRAVAAGQSMPPHEDQYWRRDGKPLPIEMTVTPLGRCPGEGGAVTVFRDISQRREVEQLKDDFVAVVSHELRTPLTSIMGSLRLLHAEAAAPLDPRLRPLMEMALRNAQRLAALVDDILDINRLDAGRMPMHPAVVEAAEIARGVVDQLQGTASLERVGLVMDDGEPRTLIQADPRRLAQALTNLVGNALKFTPEGQRVRVSVRPRGSEVRLQVRDTGPGIAPDHLRAIFERFRQADVGSHLRGTGLGLAITKAIVEQSGGRIEVASEVGVGSTFTIVLPAVAGSDARHRRGEVA